MSEGKTIPISFRVSSRFKRLLSTAAARENRSLTNMLETLLFEYCQEHGIEASTEQQNTENTKKGRTFK